MFRLLEKRKNSFPKFKTGTRIQDDSRKEKKQKLRNVICGRWPSSFEVHKEGDTQPGFVKHKRTRGLKRKTLGRDDANHEANYNSEFNRLPD